MSYGRQVLPISGWSAGVGTSCRTNLDDYSRYIITWRLTTTMAAAGVTGTLEDALEAIGLAASGTAQAKITLG